MSENLGGNGKPVDPFEPFRGMRDAYLDAMAKAMVETVNTESYAQVTGAMLNGFLTFSAPFRAALDQSMTQALQELSLPSRQELAAFAERFTNVEMRLDDLDAKLDQITKILSALKPSVESRSPLVQEKASPELPHPPPAMGTVDAKATTERAKSAPARSARKSGR